MKARDVLIWVLLLLGAVLVLPGPASGADRPKPKTLYRDGPSGRFLVGGVGYTRRDPADQGVQQGFQRTKSLAGWQRTTIPNAANAGDFSVESYMGSVQWYRKNFKAPRGPSDSKWIFRFESVNYRAKVWLNGRPLGTHVGSYLPFELRAKSFRNRGVNRLLARV